MIRAAVRRPRGLLLPQGAGPAGCTPHFLFPLVEKKTGRARSKRKDRLDALRRVRASARRGSADRCKRRFWPAFGHAIIFCNFWDCRPVADGAEVVGVVFAVSLATPQAPSYADPRTATLHARAKLRPKAIFSLPPGAAHSLFVKNKKRMGGASPVETAPWREPDSPSHGTHHQPTIDKGSKL